MNIKSKFENVSDGKIVEEKISEGAHWEASFTDFPSQSNRYNLLKLLNKVNGLPLKNLLDYSNKLEKG